MPALRSLPPPSPDEARRQAALDAYAVVGSGPEEPYDDIVRLAVTLCDVPAAAISLIDHERQWFKAQIGLDVRETARSEAICDRAIRQPGRMLVVEDLLQHPELPRPTMRVDGEPLRFYA